ncbi:MAG: TraX family protein [Candidatus Izemoplasmatales bacterium]
MNSTFLKWIAIITMTIDHIGLYLIDPSVHLLMYNVLRSVGRIAFPLFAFFIAQGFMHTRDLKKYFTRLFVFALAIEFFLFIYFLFTKELYMVVANVFWPLVFGLLAIIFVSTKKPLYIVIGLSLIILADFLGFPYGGYGVATVLVFAFVKPFYKQALYFVLINLLYIDYPLVYLLPNYHLKYDNPIQWFALLALIPIYFYNGKKGKMNSYFFYIYYPLHLVVILGIAFLR